MINNSEDLNCPNSTGNLLNKLWCFNAIIFLVEITFPKSFTAVGKYIYVKSERQGGRNCRLLPRPSPFSFLTTQLCQSIYSPPHSCVLQWAALLWGVSHQWSPRMPLASGRLRHGQAWVISGQWCGLGGEEASGKFPSILKRDTGNQSSASTYWCVCRWRLHHGNYQAARLGRADTRRQQEEGKAWGGQGGCWSAGPSNLASSAVSRWPKVNSSNVHPL